MSIEERRKYACDVCGNWPDEDGTLEHGKGCYTQSEDGGGNEYVEEADEHPEAIKAVSEGTRLAYLFRDQDGNTIASGIATVGAPESPLQLMEENGRMRLRVRTPLVNPGNTLDIHIAPVAKNSDGTEYAFFPGTNPAPTFQAEWDADLCEKRDAT